MMKAFLLGAKAKAYSFWRWLKKMSVKFRVRLPAVWKRVRKLPKHIYVGVMNLLFDNYYGVRLVRKWLSWVGYGLFFVVSLIGLFLLDGSGETRQFIHPDRANEMVIGATTILLALLVPVAIVLIEDARKSSIERQVIVKSIIRLGLLPWVLLLMCIFLFVPAGMLLFGVSITVRSIYAIVVLWGLLFIFTCFFRAYKWLSDGSTFSSGSPDVPSEGPQPEVFSSYRFARVARLLGQAKSYEIWFVIWAQWFPEAYERELHQAFFRKEFDAISSKNPKRYIVMSLELEAYLKYIQKRNMESWLFELEYLQSFLSLYGKIKNKQIKDWKKAKMSGLWRGEAALAQINRHLIDSTFHGNRVWGLFEAMDTYVKSRKLIKLVGTNTMDDAVLLYFVEKYFEVLYEDDTRGHGVASYASKSPYWRITYDNLYVSRYNISFVMVDSFKQWLFEKLNNRQGDESMYKVDNVLRAVFADADPILVGTLYWLLYLAQNSVDSEWILDNFSKQRRPFGVTGRTYTYFGGDTKDNMNGYTQFAKSQDEAAIKLFAIMYQDYFRGFWNLDELIKLGKERIDAGKLPEEQLDRVEALVDVLSKVRAFYRRLARQSKKEENPKDK